MRYLQKHKLTKSLSLLIVLVASIAGATGVVYATSCSDVPTDQQEQCSNVQSDANAYCSNLSEGQEDCSNSLSNCNSGPATSYIACLNAIARPSSTGGSQPGNSSSVCPSNPDISISSQSCPEGGQASSTTNTCEASADVNDKSCIPQGGQLSAQCSGTNVSDGIACSKIFTGFIYPLIKFLAVGVGVIVVIVIIIGGIQYATSAGNPQAAAAAQKRIFGAILALVVFALLYALLNWVVPGGLPTP